MKIHYKDFIEENFLILDKEKQTPVSFELNQVQRKYFDILYEDYPDMEGVREIILKARQFGMSSLILALFTVDFLVRPYSISICISHRKDATELLFKKVKFYIESYCEKNSFDKKQLLKSDNKGLIENATNGSLFYVLTSGAKVGGRGGSARNLHLSEISFYQDTDKITAEEIVTATAQQVPQGKGMIFMETTGNTTEDYFHKEWERAYSEKTSAYTARFFSAKEGYTDEWLELKKKEFNDERKFKREYPMDPLDAFLSSGAAYFDTLILRKMLEVNAKPITEGRMSPSGEWI